MKRFWACIAAVFLAALMVAPAGAATMAPTYVSSEPSDGEELHRAPDRVEVTFSEPLDESSKLSVEDSCGRRVDDGQVAIEGNTMSVGIALKPSGHYQVDYTATGLAGVTGSTEGGFHFMVHFGDKCGGGKGSGGHSGHGGGNGGGGGSQHNGHGGGGQGGQQHSGGSGHSGSGGHSSAGSGGTHSGMPSHGGGHRAGADSDRGRGGMHGGDHDKRRKKHGKHGKGKHRDHGKPKTTADDPDDGPTLAGGPGQPVAPDGRAVMFALAFSLLLGTVGGWFLRVSGAR